MTDRETPALYDDPALFSAYDAMRQTEGRLNEIVEQPALLSLMPELKGLHIADLGCGAGGMCRTAVERGAASALGIDASDKMLALAEHSRAGDPRIRFHRESLEDLVLAEDSLDIVVSSLALHYVARFGHLVETVHQALKPNGRFLFSVEHPVVTCDRREWTTGTDGMRLNWPVDRYGDEGHRDVQWLDLTVPREHRTVSTYVNTLLDTGFSIKRVAEPMPDEAAIRRWPRLADQKRRPPFLIVSAEKI